MQPMCQLVTIRVQQQAEDILVPPLLRNCLTLNDISILSISIFLFFPLNSGPRNSFNLYIIMNE